MNVGQLKKLLENYGDNLRIEIWGVYGSHGDLEECLGKKESQGYDEDALVFTSDISSG